MLLNRKIHLAVFAVLVATIALSAPLAAEQNATKPRCSDPRDFGEQSFCFLAQFRCLPAYFGIEGDPDYAKALKCFESNKLWDFVALMYLNGEGTPRDLQKASAALKTWQKAGPDEFRSDRAAILEKAIDRCKRHPRRCARVDFCNQLEESTREIEICLARDQLADEAVFSRTIVSTRSKLSLADRTLFDRVIAEFKAYQMDDMQRQYQAFIDGSLRDVAGGGQADYVRENFMKLMANTIRSLDLKPSTTHSYDAIQAQLDRRLASNLGEKTQYRHEDLSDPQAKERWSQHRSYIEDYTRWARESQLQWIKFRDSSAELASSLYRDHDSRFDPALSMKAAVTKLRIAELRYNPIGPESN